MNEFDFIKQEQENIDPETKIFVKKCFDIIDRLHELMDEENILQKDIAKKLGKSEAEVSKWFNGIQNFTLKSLSKLEYAFGREIIQVPCIKNKVKILASVQKRNFQRVDSKQLFENFQPNKKQENAVEITSAAA